MSKIIIHAVGVTDAAALAMVLKVVEGGRISAKDSYCALTTFSHGYRVSADKTLTGADVFRVWEQ